MTTDSQALAIARRALPTEPIAALHYACAVSRAESHYGDNWDGAGAGSFNWGAVQENHPTAVNSFEHLDHHADGSPYMGNYKRYPTSEAGFKDFAFTLLKPNVVAAAAAGDGTGAVNAQHANGYFELAPEKYAAAVEKQYNGFLASTGEPRLLTFGVAAQPPGGTQQPPAAPGLDLWDAAMTVAFVLGTTWLADAVAPKKGAPK